MATINTLVDAALAEKSDLLLTFSTPVLQVALQRARGIPIVFNYLASPQAAGAGRSDTDHLPNVTGVYLHARPLLHVEVSGSADSGTPRAAGSFRWLDPGAPHGVANASGQRYEGVIIEWK